MKHLIYIFIVIIFTACAEKQLEVVPIIEGQIINGTQKEILLFNNEDLLQPIDTILVDEAGLFKVPKQSIKTIGFYSLKMNEKEDLLLFLKPTDFISIKVDNQNILESCSSNNSKLINAIWDLKRNTAQFANEMNKLSVQIKNISGKESNDSLYKSIQVKKDSVVQLYKKKSLKIAKALNSPVINFLMLNQKYANTSLFSIEEDLDAFLKNSEELMKSPQLKTLFQEYDQSMMRAYSNIRAKQHYSSGGTFPELKARTNWNEELPLSKINGNPIHVVFWSGVDLNDADKMLQVKRINQRNASRGLKTLMVAYQTNKEIWLNSIKQNKLPYWHIIDTTAFSSTDLVEMGVKSIPCNFIVDTAGTIINRDVWGSELQEELARYFKKY